MCPVTKAKRPRLLLTKESIESLKRSEQNNQKISGNHRSYRDRCANSVGGDCLGRKMSQRREINSVNPNLEKPAG